MKLNERLVAQLFELLNEKERAYLEESATQVKADYKKHFIRIFSSLGRFLSASKSKTIAYDVDESDVLLADGWDALRLSRVWLLSLIEDQEDSYIKFIQPLFKYGEMQELTALYAALPILEYPDAWIEQCKEGIRNNIGSVQEAIIEQNIFPYLHLSEEAWNQMVLKSFFTGKNVLKIYGLFERNNLDLQSAVVDYIYERHSAKRDIHPILWLLASERLPMRALRILSEQCSHSSDSLEGSILFHVLSTNISKLDGQEQELLRNNEPSGYLPFSDDLLERYKNKDVCVQN